MDDPAMDDPAMDDQQQLTRRKEDPEVRRQRKDRHRQAQLAKGLVRVDRAVGADMAYLLTRALDVQKESGCTATEAMRVVQAELAQAEVAGQEVDGELDDSPESFWERSGTGSPPPKIQPPEIPSRVLQVDDPLEAITLRPASPETSALAALMAAAEAAEPASSTALATAPAAAPSAALAAPTGAPVDRPVADDDDINRIAAELAALERRRRDARPAEVSPSNRAAVPDLTARPADRSPGHPGASGRASWLRDHARPLLAASVLIVSASVSFVIWTSRDDRVGSTPLFVPPAGRSILTGTPETAGTETLASGPPASGGRPDRTDAGPGEGTARRDAAVAVPAEQPPTSELAPTSDMAPISDQAPSDQAPASASGPLRSEALERRLAEPSMSSSSTSLIPEPGRPASGGNPASGNPASPTSTKQAPAPASVPAGAVATPDAGMAASHQPDRSTAVSAQKTDHRSRRREAFSPSAAQRASKPMVQATKSKATLTSPVTRATKATDVASRSPGERPNGVEFEAVACVTGDKLASCAAKYGLRPADLLRLNTALNDRDVNDPLESDLTLVVPLKTRH